MSQKRTYQAEQQVGCVTIGLTHERQIHATVPPWMTGKQLKRWKQQTRKRNEAAINSLYNP